MKKSKKVLSVALSALMAFTPVAGLMSLTGCDQPPPPGPDQGTDFTVSFDTQGGNTIAAQTVKSNKTAAQPATPTRAGYIFGGWYTNAECTGNQFDFSTKITANVTLYAKWTDAATAQTVTVTLVWGEGVASEEIDVVEGSVASLPNAPTVDGKIFVAWYLDEEFTEKFDTTRVVNEDITIYARWVGEDEVYTVTFVTDYGTAPAVQAIFPGEKATYPIEKPSDANTIFSGWYIDEERNELYDFDQEITENTILYAGHQEKATDVTTIRFGGYTIDATQQETYNKMCDEFNETYGKYKGIYVQPSIVGLFQLYEERCNVSLTGEEGGFDVYMIDDKNFKAWAQKREDQIRNLGATVDDKGNPLTSSALFDQQLDNMWAGMIDRFRLNVNGWTSYEDDQLWVVPIDSNPTALYYNRTVLEKNGVIVISIEDYTVSADNYEQLAGKYNFPAEVTLEVAEGRTLLDLWNDNLIADLFLNWHNDLKFVNGETITDAYGSTIESTYLEDEGITIPAKGFFRDMYPRNSADPAVAKFTAPAEGEALVFNASIPMSWDEIEDLAMICTRSVNPSSASTYGYYTQWWFCYGWTVGGDCMEDMTGDGAWAFSLSDYTANYMVTEEACTEVNPNDANDTNRYYIGEYTGTLYSAGDTLQFLDKLDVTKLETQTDGPSTFAVSGDIILPNEDGSFEKYDVVSKNTTQIGQSVAQLGDSLTDNTAIRASIASNSSQDQNASGVKFIELPSTKEAFTRFCRLVPSEADAANSVGVSPPTSSGKATDITTLGNGDIAFIIEKGDKLGQLRNVAAAYNQSWGVANVPIFKEYSNPYDPKDDSVKRMGLAAGHSEAVALGISAGCKTQNIDEAWAFIQWMAADYFYLDPDDGSVYFGNQKKATDVRYRAGQAVRADNGYIPNQPSLFEQPNNEGTDAGKTTFIKEGEENLNLQLFAYAIEYEQPGDWWYLPTNAWISQWEGTLNGQDGVRGGKMTAVDWFNSGIIKKTNVKLAQDFSYFYNAENIIAQWENKLGVDIAN